MNDKINNSSELKIIDRSLMTLNGVSKIVSFDNTEFIIETDLGPIHITGQGLELLNLDTHEGLIKIKGKINGYNYVDKAVKKKDLAAIAMSYGYVYVAQCAMGADNNQVLKAMVEAESYNGPSLIICYAPCINHGIKGGMGIAQIEEKKAVDAGYWNIFRYDPRLADEGKNPFMLDCKAPSASYRDFIMGEVRYNSLTRSFPERAEELFTEAEKLAEEKYAHLEKLAGIDDAK